MIDVAASTGHAAIVQQDRRPVRGPLLEVRSDRLLPQVTAMKGQLVLGRLAQGKQQPADPRVGLQSAGFAIALAPLVLARHAGARLSTIELGQRRLGNDRYSRRLQTRPACHRPRRGVPASLRPHRQGSTAKAAHVGPTQLQHPRRHSAKIGIRPRRLEQVPLFAQSASGSTVAALPVVVRRRSELSLNGTHR